MQHPYFANALIGDGPPSPSPTRSKKRKRDINEEFDATPTKSRSRTASFQTLGLPTPNEKDGTQLFVEQIIQDSLSSGGTKTPSNDSVGPLQQLTPPTSASPSIGSDFRISAQINEASPTRTRASAMKSVQTTANPALMLSIPSLVVQPPNSPMHIASLEAAVLSLRRLLSLNSSGSLSQPLPPEQECCAWIMFAELGMQVATTMKSMDALLKPADATDPSSAKFSQSTSASWAPQPGEIESAISRSLRLTDQIASLRPLRHQLTLMHAKIVFMQDNHKHSKVLLKRLLPLSTTSQHLVRDKAWTSYEAHLSITDQILHTPLPSLLGVVDIQAASSQLMALNMLADQHGDFAVRQLTSVIRLTLLLQNYEVSDAIDGKDIDAALADAESLLSLDGFDKPNASATAQQPLNGAADTSEKVSSSTPGATISSINTAVTPLSHDFLAGGGVGVLANLKTPAFSLPTNPLGMNIYSIEKQPDANPESVPSTEHPTKIGTAVDDDMIPPYLRYLRVQTLMAGVLWLTHCGNSARSAERLTLLHEMMDKLNDMSKLSGAGTGWSSDHDVGVIEVPLVSNPERSLRIQATHPRVLYQLTFVISGIVKRDGAGKKPKRKIFAEEGLRIGRCDDVRVSHDSKPPITEGGSLLDLAPGLGIQALRQAQSSIQQIRATVYCELISACLIRSEFDEADQHLSDLVSFIRACDGLNNDPSNSLWDQYNSRITLLYGQLAHALGQSRRALDCYRLVCHLEEEGSILWGMGLIGEIILRIGVAAMRKEPGQEDGDSIDPSEKISPAGRFWKDGEREEVVQIASGVVEKCLSGLWGDHMAIIGRLIAASLSDEIVRAKQNLKSGLDLSCKSRDNYLRLITLILTTNQYIHTYSDYALTILETSKQIATSLGAATTVPAEKDGVDTASSDALRRSSRTSKGSTQYHVGHARAGLWIGERFLELYKRKNEREKAGKQNALNVVFDKAVQELNSNASSEEQITEFPALILRTNGSKAAFAPSESKASVKDANSLNAADSSAPALRINTSSNFVRIRTARGSTVSAGAFSGTTYDGNSTPRTTKDHKSHRHNHRQPQSAISMSRSSIYSAAASTGTRRSARSAASKRAIVESDDENVNQDEDEYEEDDSDD